MLDATIVRLKSVREQIDTEFCSWFHMAEELANSVGTELTKPQVAGFQRNCANIPSLDTSEYYRRKVAIPFLDYVIQQMNTRFPKSDRVGLALLRLLPSSAVGSADLEKLREDLLFWEIDLPSPSSLKMELKERHHF
ncbi:hypothetical protein HPB48_026593 [Haemaphysalis longicornis]|uniref:Uncharacterized protein n=1 Tax=Haemaphysalis longicornis TaxID=44386 RepID=A0A9J6HCK1_HAELO|nr:hypothetical protein HPB48_026593 [Haemaphysalis longicornis]